MQDQELEVKYYVTNLEKLRRRLQELDAREVQPRIWENNLRFDTPGGELGRAMQVLRLRYDTEARLTFKGPAESQDGVRLRKEIEFAVSDFRSARVFLEALGYQVTMIYEKYRAVYDLDGVSVTLDELPYGDFVEIEGPTTIAIQEVNKQLGLDWSARIFESYVFLFERLCTELDLDFRDLIFDNFKGLHLPPETLHVRAADLQV